MKKLLYGSAIAFLVLGTAGVYGQTSTTYTGSSLSGLTYESFNNFTAGSSQAPDSQYVPASGDIPALASLYTPDAGLSYSADSPGVFVQGDLGPLSDFSANFDLASSSGGGGNTPYWVIVLNADGSTTPENPTPSTANTEIWLLSTDSPGSNTTGTFNLSSTTDVQALDPSSFGSIPEISGFDNPLSSIYDTVFTPTGVTFGDMTVTYAGAMIGTWNISDSISASDSISSITVASTVPEPATWATMLAGLALMAAIRRFRRGNNLILRRVGVSQI